MRTNELIDAAHRARENAHAPYSRYPVGAALLTKSGRVFTGVNVENSSYGLTVCAERTAVANAVTAGEKSFTAIAIATENGAPPCGACRQVLREFAGDLAIYLTDADRKTSETTLASLFPSPFE